MDDARNRNYLMIPEKKAGIIKYHIFQKMQIGGRASTAAVPSYVRARDPVANYAGMSGKRRPEHVFRHRTKTQDAPRAVAFDLDHGR